MPARSKRSKANEDNSRKKYRIAPMAEVQELKLNKPLANHDFAEDETQAQCDGTELERPPHNARLVYFAEADKSLKRTKYAGGSERTQRRWRAQLKSSVGGTRSLFEYSFSSSKKDTVSAGGVTGMLSAISAD
ncbi:hypothetical protein V1525DRAFT_417636 [Lipomyces kononenkoae]|uniref:Uncharacterized protein n=1 Tax=Lipomyces kononenkoae TaxID=34357 RepID=A0ACC3T6S6_LIPKO